MELSSLEVQGILQDNRNSNARIAMLDSDVLDLRNCLEAIQNKIDDINDLISIEETAIELNLYRLDSNEK